MKSMFEHMATEIIIIIALFILSTFTTIEMQVLAARRVHASAIDQLQASYYSINIDDFNDKLAEKYPGWILTVDELKTHNTRKEYRVVLMYNITIPMFNLRQTALLEGYTR